MDKSVLGVEGKGEGEGGYVCEGCEVGRRSRGRDRRGETGEREGVNETRVFDKEI